MSRRAQRASRGGAAHFFSAGASVAAWNARALMADSSRCAPSCVRHAIGMIICARAPAALGSGPGALGRWPTPELRARHRPTRWRTGEAARSPPSHQVAQRARSDKRPHSVRRRRQAGPEAGPCLGRECILLSLGHLLHVRLAGRQLRRRRRQPRRRAGRPHRARHQAVHVGAAKAERGDGHQAALPGGRRRDDLRAVRRPRAQSRAAAMSALLHSPSAQQGQAAWAQHATAPSGHWLAAATDTRPGVGRADAGSMVRADRWAAGGAP